MNHFEAEAWLENCLHELPARIAHSKEVARRMADSVAQINSQSLPSTPNLNPDFASSLGLLHDIGYGPQLVRTGFHPVDGFRFLTWKKLPDMAELMVGHTSAVEEGAIRGFRIVPSENIFAKLLTYWDVQTGPAGESLSYRERLEDILARYGPDSTVTAANVKAKPRIEEIIREVDSLLIGERHLSPSACSVALLNQHLLEG